MTKRKDHVISRRTVAGADGRDPEVRLVTAVLISAAKAALKGEKLAIMFLESERAERWLIWSGIPVNARRRFLDGLE